MFAARVAVEILVVAAVEASEPFKFVFHGMRVHYIHYHCYAERVGGVDEALQVVGGAESRRCGEEVAHMVAERSIVGMFLNGHYLYGVVAVGGYTWQNVVAEFGVCAYSLSFLGHAYVALVYQQRAGVGLKRCYFPLIGLGRFPYLCREEGCVGVLYHSGGVGRDTFALAPFPCHEHFVVIGVMYRIGRQLYLPYAHPYRGEFVGLRRLPGIEVANKGYRGSVGGPFAQYPGAVVGAVQPEVIVGVGKFVERFAAGDFLFFSYCVVVASLYCFSIGFEIEYGLRRLACRFGLFCVFFGPENEVVF